MADQQRSEVTAQARRCIRSSWEECEVAVKLETQTRVLSKKNIIRQLISQQLVQKFNFIRNLAILDTSDISVGLSEFYVNGLHSWVELIWL